MVVQSRKFYFGPAEIASVVFIPGWGTKGK